METIFVIERSSENSGRELLFAYKDKAQAEAVVKVLAGGIGNPIFYSMTPVPLSSEVAP